MDELRWRALVALEDALARAESEPVKRGRTLAFTLAFLSNFAEDRKPFDRFWIALADPGEARWHHANAALFAIYAAIGTVRGEGPKRRRPEMPAFLTKADRKAARFLSGVINAVASRYDEEAVAKHEEAAARAEHDAASER